MIRQLVAILCVTVLPTTDAVCQASLTDGPPDGLTVADWSSIEAAFDAARHAAHPTADGHRAHNPGQQWQTRFDGRGFTTEPEAGAWTWGLELQRYGFAGQERAVTGPARVLAEGQHVAYAWDDTLAEWYVNDTRGLEHGFTVRRRPAVQEDGAGRGPLRFDLAVRGELAPDVSDDGRSVRFLTGDGATVLTYSGLAVLDADGKRLPARLEATSEGLLLSVDERGARYPLHIDPVAQQAYLKASNAEGAPFLFGDEFGRSVSVSADTVVIGAPGEDSSATGVNGDQADNGAGNAGAAYVFVRNGITWSQQAYLKASNTEASDSFGISVAVSGDSIVVGAVGEASSSTGVNGNQGDNSMPGAGAAYVFLRDGTSWSQQAYLKASNPDLFDRFGIQVAISGDTIVAGASSEASSATGVNGNEVDNSVFGAGAAYVFVRDGTSWSQQAYLKASNTDAADFFGATVAVSGDTIVVGAGDEDSNATGVNGNQADDSASTAGAAYVFVRDGTSWGQQAYLKASNTDAGDLFGAAVAVSGDTAVISASSEDSKATGVNGNQSDDSVQDSGAAYVFVRDGTIWSQQAYLKASNTDASDLFGTSAALSGDTIAIGAAAEASSATGVNGDQSDDSAGSAGAAYLFARTGSSWGQQAYLKASNTDAADFFGASVAVSGATTVIGAWGEDSSATGVDGNQADNSAGAAGAAYVFDIVPDRWADLGGGTPGIAGPPRLTMSGPLTPSSLVTLDQVDGAPLALALVFVSFTSTPTPFLGGTLHTFPFDELVIVGTDGAGAIHGSAFFPGAPSGQSLWFQVGIQDLSVPIYGASLSNAVKGTVP